MTAPRPILSAVALAVTIATTVHPLAAQQTLTLRNGDRLTGTLRSVAATTAGRSLPLMLFMV